MKKLAVIVDDVDPAFVFLCVRALLGVWIVTTLIWRHCDCTLPWHAAAATFYNSVSSVFEIEATVRTGQEDGGAKGGREDEEGGTVRVKNISIQIQCQCEREAKSV